MKDLIAQYDLSEVDGFNGIQWLEKVAFRVNRFAIPLENRFLIMALLMRARGRVVAELIAEGKLESDEQEKLMKLFSVTVGQVEKAKAGRLPIIETVRNVTEDLDFISRHGE